jgi:hypothetical protein
MSSPTIADAALSLAQDIRSVGVVTLFVGGGFALLAGLISLGWWLRVRVTRWPYDYPKCAAMGFLITPQLLIGGLVLLCAPSPGVLLMVAAGELGGFGLLLAGRRTDRASTAVLRVAAAVLVVGWVLLCARHVAGRMDEVEPRHPDAAPKSTAYHVPSNVSAELEGEKQTIEREKAEAEHRTSQLDSVRKEIERKQVFLDRTSQLAVDEFNRKVCAYNELLESARVQERVIDQMIANYNEKVREHGR